MNRIVTIKRHWLATLLAAVCILLGTQTAWADDDPVTYSVTRTARSNTEFTFEQPANNVEVTVTYEDAKASITPAGENPTILYYETFAEIFANSNALLAEGDVVTLLADETLTTSIDIMKNCTIDLNGHTLTYTGSDRLTINSDKTVTIQDGGTGGGITYNGTNSAIWNYGTLNFTSGAITCTNDGGVGIWNKEEGTLNLSGAPAISATGTNGVAISLAAGTVINIPAALTAPGSSPENAWTVAINNDLPYTFTGDWPAAMSTANPALFFKSTTDGVTTRFVDGSGEGLKKAQFVTYTALSDETATKPTVTAAPHSGAYWIGDELTAATTATPADGITWQWYRQLGDADPVAITGATGSTYTLSIDDYDYTTQTGYKVFAKATMAADAAGTGYPDVDHIASTAMTSPVVKQAFSDTPTAEVTTITVDRTGTTLTVTAPAQADNENANRESGKTYEYKLGADGEWQTSPEFTGLELITQYTIYARVAATNTMVASTGTNASFTTTVNSTSVSGYNFVGKELTGSHDPATIEGVSYKWYRAATADATTWTEIDGATSATYTLTEADVDKYLKFEVIKNGQVIGEYCDAEHPVRAAFDQKVTIDGVTYYITGTNDSPTVTIDALPGEDSDVAGHKQATILATIPKNHAALVAYSDIWETYGFTFTSEATGEMNVSSDNISSLDFSALGSSAGNYGYLTVLNEAIYTTLYAQDAEAQATMEGYGIRTYRGGYFALNNGTDYAMAEKNKTISQSDMTDILSAAGMSGGAIAFKDLAGKALPAGTGDDADKLMAAAGQTVVIEVTLPTGFEFASDACKILNVTYGTSPVTSVEISLADTDADGTWTAEFTMPSEAVTVSFKEDEPIQGKTVTFDVPESAMLTGGTMRADADNPSPILVGENVSFIITPNTTTAAVGDGGYALTDLTLSDGTTTYTPTYTIVDAEDNTPVTLPTEKAVKVTFKVPATAADEFTFTPTFTKTFERIAFDVGRKTYYESKGMKLRSENADLKFYTVTGVSGSTVTVTEITSKTIPANMPFIVENSSNETAFDVYIAETGDANTAYATACAVTAATQFKGSTTATTLPFTSGISYYGFNGTDFILLTNDGTAIPANRCWLEMSGGAATRVTVDWGDGTTAIRSLNVDEEDGDWYDINGRKLQRKPTKKGVYILNGQKKVVK